MVASRARTCLTVASPDACRSAALGRPHVPQESSSSKPQILAGFGHISCGNGPLVIDTGKPPEYSIGVFRGVKTRACMRLTACGSAFVSCLDSVENLGVHSEEPVQWLSTSRAGSSLAMRACGIPCVTETLLHQHSQDPFRAQHPSRGSNHLFHQQLSSTRDVIIHN